MDISKYYIKSNNRNEDNHKRTGLLNIGATCYINSLIQCLLSCDVFRDFILSKDYSNRITNSNENSNDKTVYLVKELESIFDSMWIQGNSLNPRRFLNTLNIKFDYIYVNEQNDIQEIFLLIINKINEEIKMNYNELNPNINKILNNNNISSKCAEKLEDVCERKWFELFKNEYSELSEIIYNHSISQIVCGNCEFIHHNHVISCIMDIELSDFKTGTSLKKCINNHISKIYLNTNEDNKWKCDNCEESVKSEKMIKFWKLPPVLVICLKRFGYNKETNSMRKLNTLIDIPSYIDLSDFIISDTSNSENNYKLNSVSCHSGNIGSGHYYSLVKNNTKWQIIDDINIKTISNSTFKTHLNNAYLLFYSIK